MEEQKGQICNKKKANMEDADDFKFIFYLQYTVITEMIKTNKNIEKNPLQFYKYLQYMKK